MYEDFEYQYGLSLLGIKNLFGFERIHWYERREFLPIAIKVFDYINKNISSANDDKYEVVSKFIKMYYNINNNLFINKGEDPHIFELDSVMMCASRDFRLAHLNYDSEENELTYVIPVNSLTNKLVGRKLTVFELSIDEFIKKLCHDKFVKSLIFDGTTYVVENEHPLNNANMNISVQIWNKLSSVGFGESIFTYKVSLSINDSETTINFVALPDKQYELKTSIDSSIEYMNLQKSIYLESDFSTLVVDNIDTLGLLLKGLHETSDLELVSFLGDNIDYYWKDGKFINNSNIEFLNNFDFGSKVVFGNSQVVTIEKLSDDSNYDYYCNNDNIEDNDNNIEQKINPVAEFMNELGILGLCSCDEFVFVWTNIMTTIYMQIHYTYPEFFVEKKPRFEKGQTYFTVTSYINDGLWFNLR